MNIFSLDTIKFRVAKNHKGRIRYLIDIMLSSGCRRGCRRWKTLTGCRRWRGAHATLWWIRSLHAPRTHVLLFQRPGNAKRHVALIPRGWTVTTGRRPVLLSTSGLILIIGMLALVDNAQAIGLLNEGFLIVIGQEPTTSRGNKNKIKINTIKNFWIALNNIIIFLFSDR